MEISNLYRQKNYINYIIDCKNKEDIKILLDNNLLRKQMEIREILTEESIILDLKSTTKEDIIQELVDKLYDTGSITLKVSL